MVEYEPILGGVIMRTTIKDLLKEIDDQYCENIHLEKLTLEELSEYKQKLFHDLEVAETIKGNNSYYERIVDYKQKLIGEVERLELEKSADSYYENFYLERLENYKEQIHSDLKQYKDIKSMNMLDLINSLSLAQKVEKELQDIEYWYNGTIVSSVERGISEVRELLSCYQEVENFTDCLNNFQSLFQVDEYLNKVKTNADKGQIEHGILNIESNLKAHSIINSEEEETPVMRKAESGDIYREKLPMYLSILRENLEDLKNIENMSVGKFIRTLEVADEIRDSIGIMDVWYQELDDVRARVYAADIAELLEIHEQFKVLTPYFKGIRPRMMIKEYIHNCNETAVGHEFLQNLTHLEAKIQNMEDDFIDDGFERFSNAEVSSEEMPVLHDHVATPKEAVDVTDSLQFNDSKPSISVANASSSLVVDTTEESLEESPVALAEEVILIDENVATLEQVAEEGKEIAETVQKEESHEEHLESRMMSERIQAARAHIENLSKLWTKKTVVNSEPEVTDQVEEVNDQKQVEETKKPTISLFDDEIDYEDLDMEENAQEIPQEVLNSVIEETSQETEIMEGDKLIHFQKYFEDKKAFYLAKINYQNQLKSLRDQLKTDLSEGLTFQFFLKYKDQQYQASLKKIQENVLNSYGTTMMKQLDADNSIQMLIREINGKLVKLKNDFKCLLGTKVTSYDGTVSILADMEDLSENEFYVIRETIPVLVNAIEKNMRAVLKGKRVTYIQKTDLGDFVSSEKPKKSIIRSSSYHYNTCRMLSETIPEGISPEEFDQICERLNKSLRKKKRIQEDSSDLWIAYKSSVENINSCVRSLKRASSDERVGILQKISKLSANYVNAYKEKSRGYSASFVQDIKDFFADLRDYIYEIVTGDDGFEYETGYDYTKADDKDYSFYINDNFSEKITKNDDLLFMDLDLETSDLEKATVAEEAPMVDSSIKNLEIKDAMIQKQSFALDTLSPVGKVVPVETETSTDLISFVSIDQLEQMIKRLEAGESIGGYNESIDAFQKAIC